MSRISGFFALAGLAIAGSAFIHPSPTEKNITLEVTLNSCQGVSTVLYLYEFNGVGFRQVQNVPIAEGKAVFIMPVSSPKFYYVGTNENNLKPLILGSEEEVKFSASCLQLRNGQFISSSLNSQYEQLREKINQLRASSNQLAQQYRAASGDATKMADMEEQMKKIDDRKLRLLDSLKNVNPYFYQVAALNTYLSFQNYGKGYENELVYFAKEYFKFVDWKNRDYDYLPWVYEAWKSYAETITNTGLQKDKHKALIDEALSAIPSDSRTYQLALGGVVALLQSKNHANYIPYARDFIERYQAAEPQAAERMKAEVTRLEAFVEGGTAPDFKQLTPEGKEFGLSDLRGQVVLIDFWASWCGPCRRENPNVVKMYNNYKEKGFTILGVSLDNDRNRWVSAIEADGLTWHHISDLKQWQNSAAQLYGVRSIPHTILIDREGKILARNLRGPALEAKLAEIFGE